MDEQTQSFLELSANEDLVQLVADKRAAWLFSADGARILWANCAGAAFFAAHSVSDLARLTALERSPARPHIARIAESGQMDKFSIDRLRFYRGLRVMLLTCQCKRVELETGDAAALIVCGDKGLAASKDPVSGFAHMLASDTATVFVTNGGAVAETFGALSGTPEDLELPAEQNAVFGPIELNEGFHDGVVLKVSDRQRLVVLDNDAVEDEHDDADAVENAAEPSPEAAGVVAGAAALATGAALLGQQTTEAFPEETDEPSLTDTAKEDESSLWVRADDAEQETEEESGLTADLDEQPSAAHDAVAEADTPNESPPEEAVSSDDTPANAATAEEDASFEPVEGTPGVEEDPALDATTDDGLDETVEETVDAPRLPETPTPEQASDDGFVFQPRRRPVRFAWKMDIDQRFVFLSDEFADVLGPDATDIVGQTWEEVAHRFDLDPRGQIARALDRRDTWSGKTVDWPVSGAALRVPVDMAALPAFDRNRKFEGYRGFGVCRTADAIQDTQESEQTSDTPATAIAAPLGSVDLPEEQDDVLNDDTAETAQVDETDTTASNLQDQDEPDPATPEERSVEDGSAPASPADDPVVETETPSARETETEPSSESVSSLDDLKPAQPDSLAGKTFLGASAAALVGSLARFTGKSPSRRSETVEESVESAADAPPQENTPSSPEQDSAAASKAAPTTDAKVAEDLPGAALDSKLAALKTGAPIEPDAPAEDEAADDVSSAASSTDDQRVETNEAEDAASEADLTDISEAPLEPSEAAEDAASEPEEESDAAAHETSDVDDATDPVANPAEPVGITGPAALEPAEIESAVKSLAQSYKAKETTSRDLFEDLSAQEVPESAVASSETESVEEVEKSADSEEEITETDADAADDAQRDPEPVLEETALDVVDEGDPAMAASAADHDAVSATGDSTAATDTPEDGSSEDSTAAEEREFFEETAAYETEDQAAADAEETVEPETPKTGEVIPLATARPRVVPVDTSGLSRPERQAFRKIAEALGARLEGDLEDFDEPDTPEEEPEEDLPPDVPEAGPIDPSLLDRLPIGIAIVHDREVLYANKALLAMLGYKSVAKLSQVGGLEALFIDDAEELPDAAGMDGEVDESMKLRLADGGVLTVDAHMHSVPWNGSQGLMISITERKSPAGSAPAAPASPNFFAEVRSELASAHNQISEMDTILETATDGVLVLDQHGTILKVNGSAEALFSANRADMIGAPFTEFLAPESHRAASDYLDGLSRNGVASILNDGREVLGAVPAGGLIPLFMTMGRISSGEDEVKYCAVLRDITQWKTAEEELTQAKRQAEDASSAKSDFLAKISHEIRTPLNAIIGFSEVMMEERFGPIGNDRYKDYLKDIRTSGSHIMSLVNDLLDLSKIEAGKLDLKFSSVSTSDIINECVALMQPQANRERVIIRASLPESVPNVVADPRSLRQIVLNLLSNAIKYNRSGGQVILSTALEGNGEVALRVRDTGTGMTAKQLTAALEPFRQLHTSSRGGGTGLGLPLTKALVEANRASFHIDSTPDQGTLVEIVFPTQRVLAE